MKKTVLYNKLEFKRAMRIYGFQAALARYLDMNSSNISHWKARGHVPLVRQAQVDYFMKKFFMIRSRIHEAA